MCLGIKTNKGLIGNLMILLADRCRPLYHTKLIKLLYLIDEESVRKTATPMTWLNYKAWELGPVNEDVFFSKFPGYNKFSDYVRFEFVDEKRCLVKPVASFVAEDFSEVDLEIIENVINTYGHKDGKELIRILHAKGELWDKVVNENGIVFSAQNKTSDKEIDFSNLLHDDFQKTIYYSSRENMEAASFLTH